MKRLKCLIIAMILAQLCYSYRSLAVSNTEDTSKYALVPIQTLRNALETKFLLEKVTFEMDSVYKPLIIAYKADSTIRVKQLKDCDREANRNKALADTTRVYYNTQNKVLNKCNEDNLKYAISNTKLTKGLKYSVGLNLALIIFMFFSAGKTF